MNLPKIPVLVLAGLGPLIFSAGAAEKAPRDPPPVPTIADVRYGPHPRNRFDLWVPKSSRPTPLVLQIHGGGFRAGDKSRF